MALEVLLSLRVRSQCRGWWHRMWVLLLLLLLVLLLLLLTLWDEACGVLLRVRQVLLRLLVLGLLCCWVFCS